MSVSGSFTSIYTRNWEINFLQCTPNGLLKHTELCNLLQLTAGYHAELGGLSFTDMQLYDQAWVLSRMRVEISELPKWRDIVTVKTWINDLEGSRSIRALEMYVGDKKVAGSSTYWAVFNTNTRRPEGLALPHEHFEKFPEMHPTEKSFAKVQLGRDASIIEKRTVRLSDLDIVNHANNVKYLEWCLDQADVKKLLKGKLRAFDMNFIKELKLNDEVVITGGTDNSICYFTISEGEKPCFALQLEWR